MQRSNQVAQELPSLPLDGESVLVTSIGEDLALIAGVADAMMDKVDTLLNGDPSMSMKAETICWNRKNAPPDATIGFVAIVPIRLASKVRLRSVVVRRSGPPIRYTLIRPVVSLPNLIQIVCADAEEQSSYVVDRIIQTLINGKATQKRTDAALSVLTSASPTDGWIEVAGSIDTGQAFLQGWASELPSDTVRILAEEEGVLVGEFKSASVPRNDLGEQGKGFVGLLDTGKYAVHPGKLKKLFFRGRDGWRTLNVYDRCVVLSSTDVPAHIRSGLTQASASADTMRVLRRAGERFDGRDTVSDLKVPVRIGMDMVVEVTGGGMLVVGWMLDPEGHVDSLTLCTGASRQRIDNVWTRLPRKDVSTAFQHNSLFSGRLDPSRNDHGFLAFIPGPPSSAETPVYFELAVGETFAFYPLTPLRGMSRRSLERLISPLDPRTAAAAAAIERHIGPMMQAMASPAPSVAETRDLGFDETDTGKVLVIAAGVDVEEVSVTLSLLALDSEAKDVQIIVSAPVEAFDSIAPEAERLARFYGIKVRVIGAAGVQDACDAFEAAIHMTRAETLILLAAGVLPRQAGWISLLERAYRNRSGKALVSPTILYEDNSIRFAGTWLDIEAQKLVDRYIGYPRDVVHGSQSAEVIAGSLACCIVSREAIESAGGFSRSYLSTNEKARDLCLKMRLGGTPAVWLPDVEMISADNDVDMSALPMHRLAQKIDRWSFDRKWSLLINNMR
ncbi:glycosyltransferase family 2 protein [Microvirga sp. CF3016]|uniref:glycosyltransferase family 2 protein n=1 Tax=Microvirga sp. CF3016 TaxID=3110181 RepID=UPI002E7918EF|nr:hypothetical protein [Microvirga sp. CF3016]MEE1612469.1 hypothetical protein [Microvirga sp. CF3016]